MDEAAGGPLQILKQIIQKISPGQAPGQSHEQLEGTFEHLIQSTVETLENARLVVIEALKGGSGPSGQAEEAFRGIRESIESALDKAKEALGEFKTYQDLPQVKEGLHQAQKLLEEGFSDLEFWQQEQVSGEMVLAEPLPSRVLRALELVSETLDGFSKLALGEEGKPGPSELAAKLREAADWLEGKGAEDTAPDRP